ncbi:unnamed protein product [Allacma fusca]|uniref:peptidylprolyl isomerase n=1 Tax=Allacma fusca TaxID=39272 RepID=A0A8J2JBK8_9HEXA|nr:unnamed protein product [Allacma fusca]
MGLKLLEMDSTGAMDVDVSASNREEDSVLIDYTPKPNSVDVSKAQNKKLWKEIITPGGSDETPSESAEVFVHYIGRLSDGTEFDRSDKRNEAFKFTLGNGSVILGWEEGVLTMKKGERSLLICHPEYAYGSKAHGNIPANSTLYFEIELLYWKDEDLTKNQNGGILRKKIYIDPGVSKYNNPNEGSTVEVHLEGSVDGKQFDNRDVTFILGEGIDSDIPHGVEKALVKFSEREKSRLILQPAYAFGNSGNPALGVQPGATVTYTVELKSFVKASEAWQLTGQQKLESSRDFKAKGTRYFSQEKYRLAIGQYKRIIDFLKAEASLEGNEETERKALLCAAYLNQSICYLKLEDHFNAKRNAEEALELEPKNVKGLFRLGLANIALDEPEEAKMYFQKVLAEDPSNKLATQQIAICNQQIKLHKEKEKKLFGKMFDKFAIIDKKKEEAARKLQPNGLDNLDEWKKTEGTKGTE